MEYGIKPQNNIISLRLIDNISSITHIEFKNIRIYILNLIIELIDNIKTHENFTKIKKIIYDEIEFIANKKYLKYISFKDIKYRENNATVTINCVDSSDYKNYIVELIKTKHNLFYDKNTIKYEKSCNFIFNINGYELL